MSEMKISVPPGFFGASPTDDLIDAVMRKIAIAACIDHVTNWPEKYGTEFENDVFMMHPFCWCEEEACRWCGAELAPNFYYKPLGFKLTWYKYIGRSMELNKELTKEQLQAMEQDCLASLNNKPDERG